MKQPSILLKVAAVASSLLLGSCFVSYHAGAFNWLTKSNAQPADSTSSPTPEENATDGARQPTPAMMSGSKSFIDAAYGLTLRLSDDAAYGLTLRLSDTPVAPSPAPPQPPSDTTPPAQVIMGGSKSVIFGGNRFVIEVSPPPNASDAPPRAPSQPPTPPR